MENEELDDIVDQLIFHIDDSNVTEAKKKITKSKILQLMYEALLSDRALIEEQLHHISSHRHLHP